MKTIRDKLKWIVVGGTKEILFYNSTPVGFVEYDVLETKVKAKVAGINLGYDKEWGNRMDEVISQNMIGKAKKFVENRAAKQLHLMTGAKP